MRILDAGHRYELDSLDGEIRQTLTFVKRVGDKFPFNVDGHAGTNCQEVLRALIDRAEYLNRQDPCADTEAIVGNLRSALLLFELRAARRHDRHLSLESTSRLISGPTCKVCGHLGCTEDHRG